MLKLLIPVDGSDHAKRALRYALSLRGRQCEVEPHLINVQEPIVDWEVRRFLREEEIDSMLREKAESILAEAEAIVAEAGCTASRSVAIGDVAQAIAEQATELGCDQIVMGYGAAAKANTFLNYCGVRADMLPFVADRSPQKVGKFMPGSHIPVVSVEQMMKIQPDWIVILAWNLKDEIVEELKEARKWGARFVVAMPRLEVL